MKTKNKIHKSRKKHNDEQFVRKLFPGNWIDNAKDYYVKYKLDIPKLYAKLKNNNGVLIHSNINKINGIGKYINKNGKLAFKGRLLPTSDSRNVNDQKPFLVDSSKKINEIINKKTHFNHLPENMKNYIAKIDKYVNIVHAHILTNYKDNSNMSIDNILNLEDTLSNISNENITVIDSKDDLEKILNNKMNNNPIASSIQKLLLPR